MNILTTLIRKALGPWINIILERIDIMSDQFNAKLTQLQADVTATRSAEASAVALIKGLGTQLTEALEQAKQAGATPEQLAALDALDASLKTGAEDLGAAVTANTPAASNGGGNDAPAGAETPL